MSEPENKSREKLFRELLSPFASRHPDARQPGELPPGGEVGPIGEVGEVGLCGPNDGGYINNIVRDCAKDLIRASSLWCVGYGYKCERMPDDHPIARALAALADADKETAFLANEVHNPELFKPYRPTDEDIAAFKQRFSGEWKDSRPGPTGHDGLSSCPNGESGPRPDGEHA